MRNPQPKKVHKLVPMVLVNSIHNFLVQEFDGKIFDDNKPCPICGSNILVKYGTSNPIIFCKLIVNTGFKDIRVELQRYKCKECGKLYNAQGPFYEGCGYGAAIVDLCLFFAARNPFNRVENILMNFGIQVDRDTIKNYCITFQERSLEFAGIEMMGEAIGTNFIKMFFGVNNIKELKALYKIEKANGVADETYPAKKGAKKKLREENYERTRLGLNHMRFPDSFNLAMSYCPEQKMFASLLKTDKDFNRKLASALINPLEGADYIVTDGNPSYNIIPLRKHQRCTVHLARNKAKKDVKLKKLKQNKAPLTDIKDHLMDEYKKLKDQKLKVMSRKYQQYVEEYTNKNGITESIFTGTTTTNSIEGGNWRIKSKLGVPYQNIDSYYGRTTLSAIFDSLFTFSGGKPTESFTHINSNFTFEAVMTTKKFKSPQLILSHFNNESIQPILATC